MKLLIISSAIALISTPATAQAGFVTADVEVCGTTTTYRHYGERTPAIVGDSSTGLKGIFFRISRVLNVKKREDIPQLNQPAVVSDFRSVINVVGTKLCVTGELYQAESKQTPGGYVYTLFPASFRLTNSIEDVIPLMPSDLSGRYKFKDKTALVKVAPQPDPELGERFRLDGLFQILNKELKPEFDAPCYDLARPDVGVAIERFGMSTLIGHLRLRCKPTEQQDETLDLLFTFTKTDVLVDIEHSTTHKQYRYTLNKIEP